MSALKRKKLAYWPREDRTPEEAGKLVRLWPARAKWTAHKFRAWHTRNMQCLADNHRYDMKRRSLRTEGDQKIPCRILTYMMQKKAMTRRYHRCLCEITLMTCLLSPTNHTKGPIRTFKNGSKSVRCCSTGQCERNGFGDREWSSRRNAK